MKLPLYMLIFFMSSKGRSEQRVIFHEFSSAYKWNLVYENFCQNFSSIICCPQLICTHHVTKPHTIHTVISLKPQVITSLSGWLMYSYRNTGINWVFTEIADCLQVWFSKLQTESGYWLSETRSDQFPYVHWPSVSHKPINCEIYRYVLLRPLRSGGHMPGGMSNQVKEGSLGFEKLPARPYRSTAIIQYKSHKVKFLHTYTSAENTVASRPVDIAYIRTSERQNTTRLYVWEKLFSYTWISYVHWCTDTSNRLT